MRIPVFAIVLLVKTVFVGGYNVDTTSYESLKSPKENSYFGYSIAAAEVNGSIKIWSGSPRYSTNIQANSSARSGAIYHCDIDQSFNGSLTQNCKIVQLENPEKTTKNESSDGGDEPMEALAKCSFENTTCAYTTRSSSKGAKFWMNGQEYKTDRVERYNTKLRRGYCYPDVALGTRLSGPPLFTVHEGLIAMNSNAALDSLEPGEKMTTQLISEQIKARRGVAQCLRFCYNAYSLLDYDVNDAAIKKEEWYTGKRRISKRPQRSLRVYLQYEGSTALKELYAYYGPEQIASKYWNFTEIDMHHTVDSSFQIIFQVDVINVRKIITCSTPTRFTCNCGATSDIVLADIVVTNAACEEEPDEEEAVASEQSIGMSLKVKLEDDKTSTLTTCGPLWQKNCGYAKEATGICYEMNSNSSTAKVLHSPSSKGCIRGKLDIVLLVDQSGSVNQCNFQKVKIWLRDIVRGFTIGPDEQDISIVIYSSPEFTKSVFELGFDKYGNSGEVKKQKMLDGLRKLPYEAGKTYTGLAFQYANEQFLGPNARPDAKKMVILLTDGATTAEDRKRLRKQAEVTRSLNATILAVGVAQYNEKELVTISGSLANFFPVKDFSQLQQVRTTLRQTVSHTNLEGSKESESVQNCQMGFSLFHGKNSVLMGSPGCYNRAGDVFKYRTKRNSEKHNQSNYLHGNSGTNSTLNNVTENNVSTNSILNNVTENNVSTDPILNNVTENNVSTNSILNNVTKNKINNDSLKSTEGFEMPTLKELKNVFEGDIGDSYFGYAVVSGDFFGLYKGQYIAASAPRYKITGSVLIYNSEPTQLISNPHMLRGYQLGEFYGAALCAADVNKDGYTDLLVGAPLYTSKNTDEGRVYVYLGGELMSHDPDYTLQGSKAAFSRFGLTITAVGDISLDGYEDIIVSAPQEENEMGAVYVFLGGANGITRSYVQRIAASSFENKPPFHLFGQSVASGVDIDKNGYPDIIIGSPGTDEIVVLKTKPVVHIDTQFFVTTPMIDRRDESCWRQNNTEVASSDNPCISCTACFSYYGLSVPPGIEIQYSITPDVEMNNPRVGFYETNEKLVHSKILLLSANSTNCINHTLYLKKHTKDMMTKVTIELMFDMEPYSIEKNNLTRTSLTPVLDIDCVKILEATTLFETHCEDSSSCVADISIENSSPVDEEGNQVSTYELAEDKLVRLKLEVENTGPEEAHAVLITLQYPNFLIYSEMTETSCFEFATEENNDRAEHGFHTVSFVLSKTFLVANMKCNGFLNFLATSQVTPNTHDSIAFHAMASTMSKDNVTGNNSKKIKIPIVYQTSFVLSGYSYPDSIFELISNTTDSTENSTSYFKHEYLITNTGLFAIPNVQISIKWPSCVQNSEAIYHAKYIGHSVCKENFHKSINVKNCSKIFKEDGLAFWNNESNCEELVNLLFKPSCLPITDVSYCATIDINIENLAVQDHLSIVIGGELDMTKFHYTKLEVPFTTGLSFNHKSRLKFPQDQSFRQSVATVIYPPRALQILPKVRTIVMLPRWVYIISVLAGLLLLLIAILICYYCGFFNSKYAKKKKEAESDLLQPEEVAPLNPEA